MPKVRRSPAKAKAAKSLKNKKKQKPARPGGSSKTRPKTRAKTKAQAAKQARRRSGPAAAAGLLAGRPRPPLPPPPPPRRSTFADAVAAYDRGMRAFHARKFGEAREILASILTLYPEEKELHERVQMYLNVCARHVEPPQAAPQTIEERIAAATLALNSGRLDDAIATLRAVAAEDAANDSAAYLLGVAYAGKQDVSSAMTYLERAVRLNPENRDLIRREADLDALRQSDQVQALLSAPLSGRKRKT
ncbi:MAG: tetratricopeptide repeat protein [Acidobacteriota bacterium]